MAEHDDGYTIRQLAMFQQRRDAVQFGATVDGVSHPTWDEIGPLDGQQSYIDDATLLVQAMRVIGWAPIGEDRG